MPLYSRSRTETRLLPDRAGFGGARRDRTDDLMLAKHALYQLSYGPLIGAAQESLVAVRRLYGSRSEGVVGPGRLELPTSRLSGVRSNQAELRAFGSETPGSQQYAGYPFGLAIAPSTCSVAVSAERETKTATSRTCLGVFGRPIGSVSVLEAYP